MGDPAPPNRRLLISRLEFRIRNLRSKRQGLCVQLGQALAAACPAGAPSAATAEGFKRARGLTEAMNALEAEDGALAAESVGVGRGARFANSLALVKERGETYARSLKLDSLTKGLVEARTTQLARLGRALSAERAGLVDPQLNRLFERIDALEAQEAAWEAEAAALQQASAALDPAMKRRLLWIAGAIAIAVLAFLWWLALSILW